MKKQILMIILTGLLPFFTMAQLTMNLEYRPRAEARYGYKMLPDSATKPNFGFSHRARLSTYYQNDWLKLGFGIQDVRVWGDENLVTNTGVYGSDASIDLSEGWVQMSFLKYSSLKIGRQFLVYDDQRFFSTRNWNQSSLFYDAIMYQYSKEKFKLDAVVSLNLEKDSLYMNRYSAKKMKTLNLVHASYTFSPQFTASAIIIGSGYTKNDKSETIYMRGTYGIFLDYKKQGAVLWGSAYYQNGKNAKGRDVSAYNVNVYGNKKFGKFTPGLGFSFVSGDKTEAADTTANPGTDNLFDLLYGNSHQQYGHLDQFSYMPKGTANGGLLDFYLTTEYQLSEKTALLADYHYFMLNQDIIDPRYNNFSKMVTEKSLGHEFDLGFRIIFSKVVKLQGGYSFMFQDSTLEIIQGKNPGTTEFPQWGWLMLTVNPEIFSSK
jgi:hypothetical protein